MEKLLQITKVRKYGMYYIALHFLKKSKDEQMNSTHGKT